MNIFKSMVFTVDNVPYGLEIALDISQSLILKGNNFHMIYSIINALDDAKIDYLISNVSVHDHQLRMDYLSDAKSVNRSPVFLNDYALYSSSWKLKFTGKLHDNDILDIEKFYQLVKADMEYCNHLCTKGIVSNFNLNAKEKNLFMLLKLLKRFFLDFPDRMVNLEVDLNKNGLADWTRIESGLSHCENLGILLKINADLPSEDILLEFTSHNIKAIIIPLSIFITNKSGYPVLSKVHQDYIKHLYGYKVDLILQDDCNFLYNDTNINTITSTSTDCNSNLAKIKDYYLYLTHLFAFHRQFQQIDFLLNSYLDTFQIPLQPLKDNLQSQTYECFEEDKAKYDLYQQAVSLAMEKLLSVDGKRVMNICVVGGGRGPIVRRVINAGIGLNVLDQMKVVCVEKNINAYNTLLYLQGSEPQIFQNVEMVLSDMRDYAPNFLCDIVVSELLGSFGDNELSPECLIPIEKYLSTDGIMIPQSYTSYIRPVCCPVLWANIKKIKDNYQSPYVILLHRAYFPNPEVSKCFEFTHPIQNRKDLTINTSIKFPFSKPSIIHGFAGYFHAVLYGNVELSTIPYRHSENLFSWFPIYFPSLTPIEMKTSEELVINIQRENDGKKVWYEWNYEKRCSSNQLFNESQIHNSGGLSYSILL